MGELAMDLDRRNPFRGTPLTLSRHALYAMESRGAESNLIELLQHSPQITYQQDSKTGHFVSHVGNWVVVWAKGEDAIKVLTVMDRSSAEWLKAG